VEQLELPPPVPATVIQELDDAVAAVDASPSLE